MRNSRVIVFGGALLCLIGIIFVVLSYFLQSLIMIFLGSVLIVLGIISVLLVMSLNLFIQDKELNIEKLREMGLTIVVCKECLKENVLEDQYCIYCGERLGSEEDGIQEEHKT